MTHKWHVRPYQEGDEIGIVKLMNLNSRETEYKINRWNWRYKENPYGFLTVVAKSAGEIVGHMGLFFVNLKVGDKIVKASQASQLVVHPNFRRQGIFLSIGKLLMKMALKEGVVFTYGFPNEPAYHGHLKYGWFDVSMIPVLVTYLDFYKAIKEKTTKINPVLKKFSPFVNYLYSKKRSKLESGNLSITEISSFNQETNQLWDRIASRYGVIVVRQKDYLNWRYFENSGWRYNVFVAKKEDVVNGFLVTSIHEIRDRKIGFIIDFLCNSEETFIQLIGRAVEQLGEQSLDSIKCLLQNRWNKILQKYGFTPYFQPRVRMCARINSPTFFQTYYKNAKDWFVTYGDCDFM